MWEWCMDTDNSPWLYMHNYCFAPAVNPPVERCKQKKAGGFCVEKKKWLVGERVWEWHKVKAIVDFICGSIQITRIENPFVTERFMEIMHAAAAADVHGRPQRRRNFKEGGEGFPLIQNFRALTLEPPAPRTTRWHVIDRDHLSRPRTKSLVRRAQWPAADSNVIGYGSPRARRASVRLTSGFG